MKFHFTFLILTFLLGFIPTSLPAQSTDEERCLLTLTGQNRYRTVSGVINVECGFDTEPHTAPFGNWGVASNYGDISDTDQFRGWKHEGGPSTKLHWNSCTHQEATFRAPNCEYYNDNGCTTQRTLIPSSVVTHGVMTYRSSATACPIPGTVGNEPGNGCLVYEGTSVSQTSNHMTLYELDGWDEGPSVDGHDLIKTIYFLGTSATLAGCTYEGCPERTTGWIAKTGESADGESHAVVEAELRMKAKATLQGFCDWDTGQ